MKQHIEDFLKFLESKENKKVPLVAKLLHPNKFGPYTKEDLNVKGNLNLSYTGVDYLPDNLTVKGDLIVQNSKIQSLPDNLKVEGNLYLQNSKIIKSLPDNLTVTLNLFLLDTNIESIPNNLKVGGSLYLWKTHPGKKMTPKEIKQKIEQKGGYLKGYVYYL